jgi:hypothetical protein
MGLYMTVANDAANAARQIRLERIWTGSEATLALRQQGAKQDREAQNQNAKGI